MKARFGFLIMIIGLVAGTLIGGTAFFAPIGEFLIVVLKCFLFIVIFGFFLFIGYVLGNMVREFKKGRK